MRRIGCGLIENDIEAQNQARTVEAAAERDQLRRENARLRGDLQTIAARISHDLRTPLNAIVAAGEALKEVAGESTPVHTALCEAIVTSADELETLIGRVSFLLKATGSPRSKERLAMVEPVFAALTRLESRILKQGAVIVQPEVWPAVSGVAAWLEAVWWNLIANALSHGGGGVRIELAWRQDAAQWFSVRDNGPGVSQEKRDKMFQPFHQLQEPNAPRGLGLPIVQRLVELQGGRCQYQSPAEGGSCFSFSLPLAS